MGIDSSAVTTTIDYKLTNRGSLGYAQATSGQVVATASGIVALTGLTVTATTPANSRRVRITGYVSGFSQDNLNTTSILYLYKDGTQVQATSFFKTATALSGPVTILFSEAPTNASHTYDLRLSTDAGNVTADASATRPMFILVEAI